MKSSDLIVIIPGIMGSTLVYQGKEIWGFNTRSVISGLFSLGRSLNVLKLPEGIGHNDPHDGVLPGRLFPSTTIVPGFWNIIDGYPELTSYLERRLELVRPTRDQGGNLIEFAYDWRLSNQLNGKRLADCVVPELERWRKAIGNPDAEITFICHSMGGLIARWFIEVLGGSELTKRLITLGTPYRGSIKILDYLSNGYDVGIGPLKAHIGPIIQSMPSAYQLLPTYRCIDDDSGNMTSLMEEDVPNISRVNVREGKAFHDRIQQKVGSGRSYEIFALKGISQPTFQSAKLSGTRLVPIKTFAGHDRAGDGTVPRDSSHPPEWSDDAKSAFYGQQHGSLQNNSDTLRQIFGILTSGLAPFKGGQRIGLDIPDFVQLGSGIELTAVSEDRDPTLPLTVRCIGEDGSETHPVLMRSNGDGTYVTNLRDVGSGAQRVILESAVATRPVDRVEGVTLVWDRALEEPLE